MSGIFINQFFNLVITVVLVALGSMYWVHLQDVKATYRFPERVVRISISLYAFAVAIALFALWRT